MKIQGVGKSIKMHDTFGRQDRRGGAQAIKIVSWL